jgi:hypothetical protein
MSTGAVSRHSDRHFGARAVAVRFEKGRLILVLSDRREVSLPLDLYPSLLHATDAERAEWEMIGPGKGFFWSKLDLDLSVEGLIEGFREAVPRPPDWAAMDRSSGDSNA